MVNCVFQPDGHAGSHWTIQTVFKASNLHAEQATIRIPSQNRQVSIFLHLFKQLYQFKIIYVHKDILWNIYKVNVFFI